MLIAPRQDTFSILGDLLTLADDDRILADEVDPADMAVEVNPHQRPIQPRRDLLNVRGFARAVHAVQ